jgi:hypothetical protein
MRGRLFILFFVGAILAPFCLRYSPMKLFRCMGLLFLLAAVVSLSACGQKGDLYLPEKDKPAEKK